MWQNLAVSCNVFFAKTYWTLFPFSLYDIGMKTISMAMLIAASMIITSIKLVAEEAKSPVSVGKIVAIQGRAAATGTDGKRRALVLGSAVFQDDKVVTMPSCKIQIMFDDESMISQGENSELVIDKYVFDPANAKAGSSSTKLLKGVFRVISGKIAEMNPERFKVQTKMATIGIRGCEIGFRLNNDREDILVMDLPSGKTIVIWRFGFDEAIPDGALSKDKFMSIANQGAAVSLGQGLALQERRYTPVEARKLVQESTPDIQAGDSSAGRDANNSGLAALQNMSDGNKTAGQAVLQQALSTQAEGLLAQGGGGQGQREPIPENGPDTAPYVPPPPIPPPTMVGGSPVTTWEWGIWADGTAQYYPNRASGATFLTPSQIASLGTTYNLSGSGGVAAMLKHIPSGASCQVQGNCSLSVVVGATASPQWGGSFNMTRMDDPFATDFLNFSVAPGAGGGTIDSTGRLVLNNVASFDMQVAGQSFSTPAAITEKTFEGQLIRPASGTPPIVGASGKFSFTLGTQATAGGAFGVDFP